MAINVGQGPLVRDVGSKQDPVAGAPWNPFPGGAPDQWTTRTAWDGREVRSINPDFTAWQIYNGTPMPRLTGVGMNRYNPGFWQDIYNRFPELPSFNQPVYRATMGPNAPGAVASLPQPMAPPRVGIDSNRGAWPQPPPPEIPGPSIPSDKYSDGSIRSFGKNSGTMIGQDDGIPDSPTEQLPQDPWVGRPQGPDAYNPGPPGKYGERGRRSGVTGGLPQGGPVVDKFRGKRKDRY